MGEQLLQVPEKNRLQKKESRAKYHSNYLGEGKVSELHLSILVIRIINRKGEKEYMPKICITSLTSNNTRKKGRGTVRRKGKKGSYLPCPV